METFNWKAFDKKRSAFLVFAGLWPHLMPATYKVSAPQVCLPICRYCRTLRSVASWAKQCLLNSFYTLNAAAVPSVSERSQLKIVDHALSMMPNHRAVKLFFSLKCHKICILNINKDRESSSDSEVQTFELHRELHGVLDPHTHKPDQSDSNIIEWCDHWWSFIVNLILNLL